MLSYRHKIAFDRYVGGIAVTLTRYLTRIVGLVLHRDHSHSPDPDSIVVAKILGLGSIVYTGILCRALKRRFPRAKLIYVTSRGCHGLASRLRHVDEILTIDDTHPWRLFISACALILRFMRQPPTLYFDMEVYSSWSAILATLSLAHNRYGFFRKNAEFKKGMHTHTVFFNTRRHISEIYSQMALVIEAVPELHLDGVLQLHPSDQERCTRFLRELGAENSSLILISTNASELLLERRWAPERWIEYLKQTAARHPDRTFMLTGGKDDVAYVARVHAGLSHDDRSRILDISGKLDLGAFLALLERSTLLVTIDSGPLHLAAALGTPTVSLWGPGAPEHYAPQAGSHRVLYGSPYCSPCLYHADFPPCDGHNTCMAHISVQNLLDATDAILSVPQRPAAELRAPIR